MFFFTLELQWFIHVLPSRQEAWRAGLDMLVLEVLCYTLGRQFVETVPSLSILKVKLLGLLGVVVII